MNHPHHHHHHPHHPHHHHHPHAHAGVAIGPLPNQCIGMVAAPTAGGPVLAGIGVPIMTAAAPALVPPPPIPPSPQPTPQQHAQGTNKKLVMSPDSSDDKDKCGPHPFLQARTSPSGGVVVSCSAAVTGAGNQLTWSSPTPTGPIMPAGIAYPVMGLPPGALAGEPNPGAAGMIYGVPIAPSEHNVSGGVNTVISLPSSSPAVVGPVQPPPPPLSMSSVIPTQNNPVVATTSLPPQGIAQKPPQQQPQQPVKEIIHCKSCTLFPPNPNAPPPTTREKPPGCRTAFVGGLPDNIREDIVREIFERCGEITTIRMSKKNFCHIRFEMEDFVEAALYLSGYRIRIGSNSDSANIGRLHVDYAQARDDLYEWECRQRQLLREQRHRERLEQERLHPPSPPPTVHYSDHEATNVAERIKGDDTFMKAIQILFTWLEKGECLKRNSNNFYSMIQSTNSQIRRLLNEKTTYEDDFQRAKDLLRQRMTGLLMQFTQIEKVFSAACQRKVWDHFSKAQRKNIEVWKKQATEIKNVLLEEALNERADEEMELSDLESDSSGQSNKENGEPPRAKKMRLTGTGEDTKTVHQLKEENDALRCQLEASKNEVDLIKADLRTELEMKDQQLKSLQQVIEAQSNSVSCSPSPTVMAMTSCPSSNATPDSMMLSGTTGNHGVTAPAVAVVTTGSSTSSSTAGAIMAKQNLHSPPGSVSSSCSHGFGMSPTHNNGSSIGNGSNSSATTVQNSSSNTESGASSPMNRISNVDNGNGGGNGGNKEIQGYCDSSSSSNFPHQSQLQSAQNNHSNNNHNVNNATTGKNGAATGDDNQNEDIFLCADNRSSSNGSRSSSSPCNNLSEIMSKHCSVEISISEREARLVGIISTFLHVHPFGASLDYIWSYAQKVLPMVRPNQIEVLMTKFPTLFKQEVSGIGATFERKWVFVGFS